VLVPAHGVGGAQDLPVPATLAIAGAATALAVSCLILAVAWRTPRFGAGRSRVGRATRSFTASSPTMSVNWSAMPSAAPSS